MQTLPEEIEPANTYAFGSKMCPNWLCNDSLKEPLIGVGSRSEPGPNLGQFGAEIERDSELLVARDPSKHQRAPGSTNSLHFFQSKTRSNEGDGSSSHRPRHGIIASYMCR